ncbi:MAG: helix-turn-helix domain-containing protein [Planctomycetes bacterium]|nr:helix-turn-helix domain-containing protein [Planctomycetota bacterium]
MSSGRGGIRAETFSLIQELLHEGMAQRAIAKQADVHRETVRRIARGQQAGEVLDYRRCPGCGGLVLLPCLACEV